MKTFTHISYRSALVGILSILAMGLLPLRASAIYVPTAVMVDVPFTTKEYGLDVAMKVAAGIAQDALLESIRNWIVSGFEGSPSFVTNPKGLLSRVQQETAGAFLDQLNLPDVDTNLCAPFRAKIKFKVAKDAFELDQETFNDDIDELKRKSECFIDTLVTSGDIEAYYQDGGFITEGGFNPLLQGVFNPANDPLEAPDYVAGIQRARQAKEAANIKEEVALGLGFEGLKECATGKGELGVNCTYTLTKTPAKTIGAALEKTVFQSIDEIANADEISELITLAIKQLTMMALSNAGLVE